MRCFTIYNILLIFSLIVYFNESYGNSLAYYQDILERSGKEYTAGNYAKSLEYLIEVKTFAEVSNHIELQMHALNNMGIVYTGILDYEKAIECYLEAYQIAIKEQDKRLEMAILSNISELYSINNEPYKAKEYVEKAYEGAIQIKDSLRAGRYATNLASFANQTGDLIQAEKYIDIAMSMLEGQTGDSSLLIITKLVEVENLYLKKEYNKAEQLAMEVLDEVYKIKNDELTIENLLLLSKINQQKNHIPKSINYAKECFGYNPNLPVLIEIYQQLSSLFRINNSLALALEYQDSVMIIKDSLAKITDMSRVANNQIRFDLINSEKELAENRTKQKSERKFFISATSFVIILILVLLWIFRIRSIKNKQYKIISELELDKEKNNKLLLEQQLREQEALTLLAQEQLNNEQLLLRQQLHEQEVLSSLEQERLNNEIDLRNRQLMIKILFQSERNELIKEIVNTLSSIPDYDENKILCSVIQQLKLQLKESSDWNSFLTYFEQINPSFLSSLKKYHPELTVNEIRLLSYVYLNLDTKEISKLLNITPNYCRKKKQRISKKINISTSDIYDYIINFV